MRPSSPVLFASRPTPLYQHSLLEKSDSGSSGNTTGNSLGMYEWVEFVTSNVERGREVEMSNGQRENKTERDREGGERGRGRERERERER